VARIAVLHNTLDLRGGADAVCLHVCRALREQDVTLYTISETDPHDLGQLFGIEVDVRVRHPPAGRALARAFATAAPHIGPQLAARSALLARWVRPRLGEYDLVVSTANEFALPVPSVQYVHFPQFSLAACPPADPGRLNGLWTRLAGVDGGLPENTTLAANSGWTAAVVDALYGRRPSVVYPPVDRIETGVPWHEREQGVVAVGRLAPDKRVLDAISVVDGVRECGHDCHLHVVGSAAPAYRDYVNRVERATRRRPYVHLERDIDRDRLETLLGTHRYGLNTKPQEHFGMSLAECVAAGMIAFAPDSGGQVEILDSRQDRLFDTPDEAADLLAAAVERGDRPTLDRDRFASERFHEQIRALVAQRL
jgi:glycosyltransferase involved in cell wall biosynthesis